MWVGGWCGSLGLVRVCLLLGLGWLVGRRELPEKRQRVRKLFAGRELPFINYAVAQAD